MKIHIFRKTLLLAVGIAIALRIWLSLHDERDELHLDKILTFVVSVTACAAAIYAIYETGRNVQENTAQQRTKAAFMIVHHFIDDKDRERLVAFRVEAIRDQLDAKGIETSLKANNLHQAAIDMFTNFEIMALAIKSRHVNEDILYYSLGKFVIWTFDGFSIFISERRHLWGESYLIEFRELVVAWRDEKSLVTGRKFIGNNYNEWVDTGNAVS